MRYTLFPIVAGLLLSGTLGCQYKSMPMDSKDLAEHPLAMPASDYRAQIFLDQGAMLSRPDLHFSRWDFAAPQGWKQGWYINDHPALPLKYTTRCDVDVTVLQEDHQDQHKHFTYVIGDNNCVVPAQLPSSATSPLQTPTSAVPYSPFDIVLNQVGALSGKLPDKTWTVDDRMSGVKVKPGVRAFYFMRDGQVDSTIYVVEKVQVYSGWTPGPNLKPTPIGENPVYFVFESKGSAWPTFDKDVMSTLFTGSPDDMYAAIGTRNFDK